MLKERKSLQSPMQINTESWTQVQARKVHWNLEEEEALFPDRNAKQRKRNCIADILAPFFPREIALEFKSTDTIPTYHLY